MQHHPGTLYPAQQSGVPLSRACVFQAISAHDSLRAEKSPLRENANCPVHSPLTRMVSGSTVFLLGNNAGYPQGPGRSPWDIRIWYFCPPAPTYVESWQ
jgi:hypothetical protein